MTLFLPVHSSRSLFSRSLSSYSSSSNSLSYCSLTAHSPPAHHYPALFPPALSFFPPPLTFSPPGHLLPSHTPPAIPFPAHSPPALPLTAAISSRLLSFRLSLTLVLLSFRSLSSFSPFSCFLSLSFVIPSLSLFAHSLYPLTPLSFCLLLLPFSPF
ncbi:unnamed protein product [Acanthosepion pharaonis]|uniref:Uncharacterized protein n=1 Tax=Acanthosepion pharaonis TaxID=158019 RepID=A0A812EIJ8_ACAPH|nr:unnamed protein product [Sepia pharaonis]